MKIRVQCPTPNCGNAPNVDESDLGRMARCPRCRNAFVLSRWSPGEVLLGEFEIERRLGAGGMGTVFLVKSRSTGQRFALKAVLPAKLHDEDSRRAILDELQTWIDLPDHPHLAACRFFRTIGNEVAIFAEYVEGGSLHDWIQSRKLTQEEQILDVAIQFAWGLHAAHEMGLIHQDAKPGNVLMMPDGTAKVADFGLARRVRGRSATRASVPRIATS